MRSSADVRGLGAMIGIELVKDRVKKTPAIDETKKLVEYCHKKRPDPALLRPLRKCHPDPDAACHNR